MTDYIYYYTKDDYKRTLLGEVQTQFNISFTMDGTKDSMKVIVFSFQAQEIEPQTIVKHENTNTWWVVSHDKVERNTNENGFYYIHNLDLVGAIELLNARDLTDCGFNQNNYTIEQFIKRLFTLSNFEFPITFVPTSVDKDMLIDYKKTFENYTLLSAIREFLDGYNSVAKMGFEEEIDPSTYGDNEKHIYSANIYEMSKTGNQSNKINENVFTDIRETKTMDKNSFGTIVVSNAENVVSTKAKTFPTAGSIRLSSHSYYISKDNAVIRLPSNIFTVNWVDMIRPIGVYFTYRNQSQLVSIETIDKEQIKKILANYINSWSYGGELVEADIRDYYLGQVDFLATQTIKGMTTRFWHNDNYDPVDTNFLPRTDVQGFYMPYVVVKSSATQIAYQGYVQVTSKELGENTQNTRCAIYFERGKNEITHFEFLGRNNVEKSFLQNYDSTDLKEANRIAISRDFTYGTGDEQVVRHTQCEFGGSFDTTSNITPFNTSWRVNYIPMGDLKVKYDNSGDSKDIQLYNQTGKLTDSSALSKLLLSYSKEIVSNNITKFKTSYSSNFESDTNIPKIGYIVSISGNQYVINNASYDFYPNEISASGSTCYAIVGEYTMSKNIAVKSLLTSPNTNIRDYGIPQNDNVARKQLYRDFYELSLFADSEADTLYYMPLNKMLNVSNYYKDLVEHVAVMKLTFDSAYGGGGTYVDGGDVLPSDTWYYQLDTTTYVLKKAIYEVVNLNDNNIIGYCSQNVHSAWDIKRLFLGFIDNINTPISYVDDNGKVKSFTIAMCNLNQITNIYWEYLEDQKIIHSEPNYNRDISNYSIFIPSDIYEGFTTQPATYSSNETTQEVEDYIYDEQLQKSTYKIDLKECGQLPQDFNGSVDDIDINMNEIWDSEDNLLYSNEIGVTLEDDVYYVNIVMTGRPETLWFVFNTEYTYSRDVKGAKDNCDFKIVESEYYKDALEVPVFEYSCQIDDSESVIIGENVFDNKQGDTYAYTYYFVDKNTINENNFNSLDLEKLIAIEVSDKQFVRYSHAVSFEISNSELKLALYGRCDMLVGEDSTPSFTNRVNIGHSAKDLVIVRQTIPQNGTKYGGIGMQYWKYTPSLMFVIKGVPTTSVIDNKIVLKINHYNIK